MTSHGFSLMEVLLAVGTLAVGMLFIAGVFPVGIHFTTVATERTTAAIVADEAFAKIKLYGGLDPNSNWISALHITECNDFSEFVSLNPNEFAYPSTRMDAAEKQYFWSALCRREGPDPNRLVQVTVFVSRKVGSGTTWPVPAQVGVTVTADVNELEITGNKTLINDGDTIVENSTGQIYRVVKRSADTPDRIELDRAWQGGNSVWVVPPPVGSGRKPCIVVYQKGIRF